MHDVSFEEADVSGEMRRIDIEEGEIIDRARLRASMTKSKEVYEEAGSVEVIVDSMDDVENKLKSIDDEEGENLVKGEVQRIDGGGSATPMSS